MNRAFPVIDTLGDGGIIALGSCGRTMPWKRGAIRLAGGIAAVIFRFESARSTTCGAEEPALAEKGGTAMPGPQFLTPQPVSASRPSRRFTVNQANKALPLVKRVVADIVRAHEEVCSYQAKLEIAAAKEQPGIQSNLQQSLEHLQDYVDELTDIGCELKDYRLGLIDFIGRHKGHDVYLCWKLGEETVSHWHEIQTGFAGRQPVATIDERE